MRILVVEDDADVAASIRDALEQSGYLVDHASDGEEGQYWGETNAYDAIVLDLGLPVIDGVTLLASWRENGVAAPVLVLSARSTWRDKVMGLRAGADDYLAKPFHGEEVVARLEALIRRAGGHSSPILTSGPVTLDMGAKRVTLDGKPVKLTPMEFRLLAIIMHRAGAVVSKGDLADRLHGPEADLDSNSIEVIINRLRRKLGENVIMTHRGQGYALGVPENNPR